MPEDERMNRIRYHVETRVKESGIAGVIALVGMALGIGWVMFAGVGYIVAIWIKPIMWYMKWDVPPEIPKPEDTDVPSANVSAQGAPLTTKCPKCFSMNPDQDDCNRCGAALPRTRVEQ